MWPFLFVLAIVPLIFYWSDSVRELFPVLSDWLPDKESSTVVVGEQAEVTRAQAQLSSEKATWMISRGPKGLVAWADTKDRRYRLIVGCSAGAPPAVEVRYAGEPFRQAAVLDFRYGRLALESGVYSGNALVASVAQFGLVSVADPEGWVFAQFSVSPAQSGMLAREVESTCKGD